MMAQNLSSIKTANSQPTITDKTNALVKEEEKNNFPLPVWKQLHALLPLSFFLYAVSSNRWLYPNQINSTTTTTKQPRIGNERKQAEEGERIADWAEKKKKPKNSSRHRKQDLNFPLQSII